MLIRERAPHRWGEDGGVRVPHVNASADATARNLRPQSLHREEWKIYIKPSEKSTTHPWGGGPDVRSIPTSCRRAVDAR